MRTAQDLLLERHAACNELRRETDPIAREMLQFQIDQIDRELARGNGRTETALEILRRGGQL